MSGEFVGIPQGQTTIENVRLEGYEYKTANSELINFDSCIKAVQAGESQIAGYELFRFRLLLNSCYALEKYLSAKPSNKNYFQQDFNGTSVKDFPAASVPLLNQEHKKNSLNKTLNQHLKIVEISTETNGSIKVLTEEDELYYSLMARGDFTNDGIEDLLVKSEWFARKARGKHVDLLILSKTDKDQPITIYWRLMKI